jgi:predicted MFS family arabinose efflux permease
VLGVALASLSVLAHRIPSNLALGPVLLTMVVWGVSAWAFYPAQQARLIDTAGLRLTPIILSLNASFMYLGFSFGAALGAVALVKLGAANIGFVGAAFELAALVLLLVTSRRHSPEHAHSTERT